MAKAIIAESIQKDATGSTSGFAGTREDRIGLP